MFRVLLATYLALFACFLPALHTCEPMVGPVSPDGPESGYRAPDGAPDHSGHAHDDLCVICRLTSDSGGIPLPVPHLPAMALPVSDRVVPETPTLLPALTPAEPLPRAPPA